MWRKFANSLESGDKDELIEIEETELGSPDVEERGKSIGKSKESFRTIKQFAMHLNLHGFRYCFDNKIYRRIFWIILLIISMGIFINCVCVSIGMYLAYPLYTVSTTRYAKRSEAPAISFCNRNDLRSSIMNGTKLDSIIKLRRSGDNLTKEEYIDTYLNASHRIEDMLYSCKFGWWRKCRSSDFKANRLQSGDTCFTLNPREHGIWKLSAARDVSPLTMVINTEHHDYYFDRDHVGIDLIIHGADEIPSRKQRHLIAPGFFVHVDIERHELIDLPPPYSKCGSRKLKYFKSYTVQHCYLELLTDHVVKRCGCRDLYMPGNARFCSFRESTSCMWMEWAQFDRDHQQESSCPLPCKYQTYSSTLSFALFPSNLGADRLAASINHTNGTTQERRQFIRENFLKVEISFSDYTYKRTQQVPLYDGMVHVIAMIGGLMALFLGASLLTYVELIDFILSTLFTKWKRK